MKTLLIPEKVDSERLAVTEIWQKRGGSVMKIGKFWELPELNPNEVAVYGNDTFYLVIAEKLGLQLDTPDDELLIKINQKWLKRKVEIVNVSQIISGIFPVFIKSVIPKQFKSKVYQHLVEWQQETVGLPETQKVYCSEIIEIEAEARFFIKEGIIVSGSLYEGDAGLQQIHNFAEEFLKANKVLLPENVVLDFGFNHHTGTFFIEANAVWGAGLNGCSPEKVIDCIESATRLKV
jgi:hypothetical protein